MHTHQNLDEDPRIVYVTEDPLAGPRALCWAVGLSLVVLLTLLLGWRLLWAQDLPIDPPPPPGIPASVRAYEAVKAHLPPMQVSGTPLAGLSLCKLLARRGEPQPFFALPSDLAVTITDPDGVPLRGACLSLGTGQALCTDETPCDLSSVLLAYGGWSAADLEDPSGPRFSQAVLPSVEIVQVGTTTVIYLNHYLKHGTPHTPAGVAAATAYLTQLPAVLDVRGQGLPLFPVELLGQLPPRRR